MKKITNVAIIGTGKAAYQHYKCLKKIKIKKIFIITRKINNKKKNKYFTSNTFFVEGIQNIPKTIDAIIVATPWYLNDKFLKIFSNYKIPILFEKPIGFSLRDLNLIQNKNKKFVGLNRRFFDTISYVKKILKNKKYNILDVEVRISEKYKLFEKRFGKLNNKIFYFSSIHIIDLIIYLFGEPNKLNHLKKNNNSLNKFFNLYYKKFHLSLNIYDNTYENNSILIRFTNGEIIMLKPLEKLYHYKNLQIKSFQNKKIYIPKLKKVIIENQKTLKPGFLAQMRFFIKNKLSLNIREYIKTQKILNFISNA